MSEIPIWKSFLRAFGFCYPDKLIVAHREDKENPNYIENFTVKHPEEEELPVLKKAPRDIHDLKNIDENIDPEENLEDELNFSIVHDHEDDRFYQVQGNVQEDLEPASPVEYYPLASAVLILPGFIIYTMVLFWSFGYISMGHLEVAITVFLMSTLAYQGYSVYNSPILTLDIDHKAQIENYHLYVPRRSKYLQLKPTDQSTLKNQTISLVLSYIRSILAENKSLIEETNNMEDRVLLARKMGERKVLAGFEDNSGAGWITIIIGIAIGFLAGWLFAGGLSPAPAEQIILGVMGL